VPHRPPPPLPQGPKVFFDSSKDCVPDDSIRWEEGGKLLVEVDGSRFLCGDYQLWVLTPPRTSSRAHVASDTSLPPVGGTAAGRGVVMERRCVCDRVAQGGGRRWAPRELWAARPLVRFPPPPPSHPPPRPCSHAARFVFHSSMLEQGINTFGAEDVDIFRGTIDKRGGWSGQGGVGGCAL
jgi:hypothetical protein